MEAEEEGFACEAVVTAEEVGFYMPHAAAYWKVIEVLGMRADGALFVAGSAAARMRVVSQNWVGLEEKGGGTAVEREGRMLGEVVGRVLHCDGDGDGWSWRSRRRREGEGGGGGGGLLCCVGRRNSVHQDELWRRFFM